MITKVAKSQLRRGSGSTARVAKGTEVEVKVKVEAGCAREHHMARRVKKEMFARPSVVGAETERHPYHVVD